MVTVTDQLAETSTVKTIPVDAEHSGLRIVVFGGFIVGWIIGYLLISLLLPGVGLNILALGGGFVVGYAVSYGVEKLLRSRWPSGRSVEVDTRGVRIKSKGAVERDVTVEKDPASVLTWRFQTPRRSRVPKGWYVLACGIEQGDSIMCFYAFMSPKEFKTLDLEARFTALKSKKKDKSSRGGRDDLLLAGEQRRLYQAEHARWDGGAEMSTEDFLAFLDTLRENFPAWVR